MPFARRSRHIGHCTAANGRRRSLVQAPGLVAAPVLLVQTPLDLYGPCCPSCSRADFETTVGIITDCQTVAPEEGGAPPKEL